MHSVLRYPVSAVVAAGITFVLLFTMQTLIASGRAVLEDEKRSWRLDFVRLKRAETVNRREREKPQRAEKPEPPAPTRTPSESAAIEMAIDIPIFDGGLDLAGGPALGAAADGDVVPMVRVNPQYPQRAAAKGIEGWVHLRFTVTAQGTTTDVQVLDADPQGYFENAATGAVKRYKYKPRVVEGNPVPREGVEVVLTFEMEKS